MPATGPLLYDNSTLWDGYYYYPTDATGGVSTNEFGDEITLAPASSRNARTIGTIKCEYYATHGLGPGDKTMGFRLYGHPGLSPALPVPPRNALYDSGPVPIRPGFNVVSMDGLNLPVIMDADKAIGATFLASPGAFTEMHMAAGAVELRWTGLGVLQQASSLGGPWGDIERSVRASGSVCSHSLRS